MDRSLAIVLAAAADIGRISAWLGRAGAWHGSCRIWPRSRLRAIQRPTPVSIPASSAPTSVLPPRLSRRALWQRMLDARVDCLAPAVDEHPLLVVGNPMAVPAQRCTGA